MASANGRECSGKSQTEEDGTKHDDDSDRESASIFSSSDFSE